VRAINHKSTCSVMRDYYYHFSLRDPFQFSFPYLMLPFSSPTPTFLNIFLSQSQPQRSGQKQFCCDRDVSFSPHHLIELVNPVVPVRSFFLSFFLYLFSSFAKFIFFFFLPTSLSMLIIPFYLRPLPWGILWSFPPSHTRREIVKRKRRTRKPHELSLSSNRSVLV
jgi:hypothetical protein